MLLFWKDDEEFCFVRCLLEVNGFDIIFFIKIVKWVVVIKNFIGILYIFLFFFFGKLLCMLIKYIFEIDVVWLLFLFDVLRILLKIK